MRRTGYKVVHREGDHAISLADRNVRYPLHVGAAIQGPVYLGTSRAFAADYYASFSDDPEDPEELLLTVEYDDGDIIKGDPDEPDQLTGGAEVLVRRATLRGVESLKGARKESSGMRITEYLDRVADSLESRGMLREAYEVDVLANTVEAADIMTQYAKPTKQENMTELNFAAQFVKGKPQRQAMDAFNAFWGDYYGPYFYKLAVARSRGGMPQEVQGAWDRLKGMAKTRPMMVSERGQQPSEGVFVSQEEATKARALKEQQEAERRRRTSPFVNES